MTGDSGRRAPEIFREIYRRRQWGRGAFNSGRGSMPCNSAEYRAYVTAFMQTRQISSVVDLGCGDFQVSRLMD